MTVIAFVAPCERGRATMPTLDAVLDILREEPRKNIIGSVTRKQLCALARRGITDEALERPLRWAFALGLDVRRHGFDDAPSLIWDGGAVVYGCASSPRARGFGAYGAIACHMLERCGPSLLPGNVWPLACELAMPTETTVGLNVETLADAQRHVPIEVIAAWFGRARTMRWPGPRKCERERERERAITVPENNQDLLFFLA